MSDIKTIPPSLFLDIVTKINQATSLENLFDATMTALPIEIGSYHHFPSVGAFDYTTLGTFHAYNIPQAIQDYYNTYDMSDPDPNIVAVFAKGGFVWLSDLPSGPFTLDENQNKLAEDTMQAVGDALCIPLFGPNNRRGYLFVAGGLIEKENGPFLAHQIQALASLFHTRFCLIIQNIQKHINLTDREAEVVELLTYGKTNSEIANILNISASTVAGYVKSIFIKLDVSDRVSASMRAQTIKVAF